MATVWLALRADVRRRWRALVSLALLLGLAGGVVLIAAVGAQRTDTAYPRLLSWANASQIEVAPGEPDPGYFAALARLPQVAAVETANQYTVALPVPHAEPDPRLEALSSPDGTYGATVDRVKILAGRMFSPRAADEAVIDPQLASMEHLRPGDTLHLLGIPGNTPQGPDLQGAFPLDFRVTAIAVFDDQVVSVTATNSEPLLIGIPVGVVAGRWAWALFASAAGVANQATVNVPLVLLAIPVTLLLANVIAAWPGWTAARLRPAAVLRAE